jgi:hypothetical protein
LKWVIIELGMGRWGCAKLSLQGLMRAYEPMTAAASHSLVR